MLKEDADVALLRVFKSFLEAAPQLVLQISYLLKSYYHMKGGGKGNNLSMYPCLFYLGCVGLLC